LNSLIEFFLRNEKFNYGLFFAIIGFGIFSYSELPKEKFPIMDLDRIVISGGYTKISNDLLDTVAVREIESEIKGVEGISELYTVISNGSFSIVAELIDGVERSSVADKLRDAVAIASKNLPSDMNLPTVREVSRTREVIKVALTSSSIESSLDKIDRVKERLLSIEGVANVSVSGERDRVQMIQLDEKRLELYGISLSTAINTIKTLSYIYPLGKIEDRDYHLFLLSEGGKESLENSVLRFGDKQLFLGDIATVQNRYEDSQKSSMVNLESAVTFEIFKFENGNSMEVAGAVKSYVNKFNQKNSELKLIAFLDDSKSIRNRLNSVVSNILFGMILVFFSIYFLVSKKMALVVTVGVPTSFFIAFIFLYLSGFSLNLISLLALLIALGVLVDDAIIVSENIQRHLEEGKDPVRASIDGTREVITPVTMASLTTLFTFMPLLFLSGTTGNFIIAIPIVVSVLVVASYMESFFFLPLHSKHLLRQGDKVNSWGHLKEYYKGVLSFLFRFRKSVMLLSLIGLPFLLFISIKETKFQFFPKIDAPILYISGKVGVDSSLQQTEEIAKRVSAEVWRKREELGVANISTVTGFRRTPVGERENGENLFYIYLELYEQKPQNFVEEYITPYLSFDYDGSNKIRELSNREILKQLNRELKPLGESLGVEDLSIFKKRIGVKVDVEIGILADTTEDIFHSIESLNREIEKIDGVSSNSNNAIYGVDELVLKINSYGEELGVTEGLLSETLSNLYLSNRKSMSLQGGELVEVIVESQNIEQLDSLSTLSITLPDGKAVRLTDIADFEIRKSLETVDKNNYRRMKSIFINVDSDIITADEVLQKLQPTFDKLRLEGISFDFLGEKKKRDELRKDLSKATLLAIVLIILSLLYTFNSWRLSLLIFSVIPLSLLGVFWGHFIMGLNLTMPGIIGAFGLAGVVINDSIVMLSFLYKTKSREEILERASYRFRPIVLTSLTTLIGLSTLIFFVTGQALILQPIAISLGFGLAWGTLLNLLYIPVMYYLIKGR
jgi:multidrug efflux pump subunit AcrB